MKKHHPGAAGRARCQCEIAAQSKAGRKSKNPAPGGAGNSQCRRMLLGVLLFLFLLALLLQAFCRLLLFVLLGYESFCHGLKFMIYK